MDSAYTEMKSAVPKMPGGDWQYEVYRMFLKKHTPAQDRMYISNICVDNLIKYSAGKIKIEALMELRSRLTRRKGRNSFIVNEIKALFESMHRFFKYLALSANIYFHKWQKKS